MNLALTQRKNLAQQQWSLWAPSFSCICPLKAGMQSAQRKTFLNERLSLPLADMMSHVIIWGRRENDKSPKKIDLLPFHGRENFWCILNKDRKRYHLLEGNTNAVEIDSIIKHDNCHLSLKFQSQRRALRYKHPTWNRLNEDVTLQLYNSSFPFTPVIRPSSILIQTRYCRNTEGIQAIGSIALVVLLGSGMSL